MQRTLFGGFAKSETYYKHTAKSQFEKVIEALLILVLIDNLSLLLLISY